MILSDGVHDNLDPKSLGKEPSDFGLEGAWEAISPAQAEKIKQKCAFSEYCARDDHY